MQILNLVQGTDEWRAMRRSKVGASDIATLMVGSQKEICDLYWEKFGQDKYETSAMRRGSDMESEARQWFEREHAISFERPVGIHDTHDWLIASFDGINFELGLSLEIKCPNEVPDVLETWKSFKRYWWQVQAQLAVGGHDKSVLLVYGPTKQVRTFIQRDEGAIEELVKKGAWFYDLMQKNTPPPEPITFRDDKEAVEFAEAAKLLKGQMKELDEQWEILKEGGIYLARESSFECNGVKVIKVTPEPCIDYKAAFEALLPSGDPTPYLKQKKPFWRVSV